MIKEQEYFLWIRLIGKIVTRKIKIATKAANPVGEGEKTVPYNSLKPGIMRMHLVIILEMVPI